MANQKSESGSILLGFIAGGIIGVLSANSYYQRKADEIDARWQAVTSTTIEQAEVKVKSCQPCYGTIATHRGKR